MKFVRIINRRFLHVDCALSFRIVVVPLSNDCSSICPSPDPQSMPLVVHECAFVGAACRVLDDTLSVSLALIVNLAVIVVLIHDSK